MSNWALYTVTVLIWGSTWIMIEYQLGVVPPVVSVFYRFVIAAAILFAWCLARGLILSFSAAAHLRFALLGVLLFGLNYVCAYHAQEHIASALVAIAFSTILWMNILNARMFLGVRAGARVVLGALLGVVGIVIMFAPSVTQLSLADASVYGAVLGMLGAYLASLGNIVSQAAQRDALPIVQSNAWGMLYGATATGAFVVLTGQRFVFDFSTAYVVSLAYLVVFGSIVAFGAYLTLVGRIGAHKAGYVNVLYPVVALTLSALFEGLEISAPMLIGTGLVLAGNYFVMRRPRGGELPAVPNEATVTDTGRPISATVTNEIRERMRL